MTKLAFSCHF